MIRPIRHLAFLATLAAVSYPATATPLGLSTDPMGAAWDRGDTGTAFGTWDEFPSFSFSVDAAEKSNGFQTLGLNQAIALTGTPRNDQGAGTYNFISADFSVLPGDDLIYSGGRSTDLSIVGSTQSAIKGLVLQVKQPVVPNLTPGALAPTLNGIAADGSTSSSGTGDTTSTDGDYSVTTWYWNSSLVETSFSSFTLAIAPTATRQAFDGFTIDVFAPTPVVPDTVRPELTVRGRKTIETLRKRVVIRGTARDASNIADLDVRAKGATVQKTRLKGADGFKVVLRIRKDRGRIIVKLRATDGAGLTSKPQKVRILRR